MGSPLSSSRSTPFKSTFTSFIGFLGRDSFFFIKAVLEQINLLPIPQDRMTKAPQQHLCLALATANNLVPANLDSEQKHSEQGRD